MLEIGSECISCGITYKKLKEELCNCSLIKPKENDTTVKLLFEESFLDNNHAPSKTCVHPFPDSKLEDSDPLKYNKMFDAYYAHDHLNSCTYFLNKEALMNLFSFRESQNNKSSVENAKRISWYSLLLAGCILLANVLGFIFPKSVMTQQQVLDIQNQVIALKTSLCSELELIYQSANVHQADDSVQIANLLEKSGFDTIPEILKSLNWKLLKIKQNITETDGSQ